ncbi:hypothetical protein cypCar_00007116 [Cyprinus carpio]|nr:hypothetical protein cypCar_00007116 [Cyprinus carpio]
MESPRLPTEIISYILSFLHVTDRKEASLVCKSWYDACQDHQKNVTFKFPVSTSSLDFIRELARRPRCGLVISRLDGSSLSRRVLLEVGLHLGPRLDRLALPGSSITEASLLGLLPHLTGLRKLDLQGLDSLFMSGAFLSREEHRRQVQNALRNLEELDLSDLRYLSDLSFNRLTSCTPRLCSLSLAGCHIAFEYDPYRGCPVGFGSSALVSLRNLLSLLQKQASTLHSLDLSRTSITPESLRSIAQVPGLRLEDLSLRGCKELTDYSMETLCKHQNGLKRLDLSACTELTSRTVLAVATELKELRSLSLSQDWKITDKGLAELMMLPCLRSLDLSECLHVSGADLVKGLSSPQPRAQLETLSLRNCAYIREDKGPSFTRTVGNMGFFKPPTLPFQEKPRLVTEEDLGAFRDQEGASLLALRGLQELDLSACSRLTDTSITQVLRFPDLQRLSLSMLPEISDDSLVSVAHHCRSLTSLALNHCPQISDQGMARALPLLHRLQHLFLACCDTITNETLSIIALHCERLRTLDVSMCKDITVHQVDLLQFQLPFLEKVQCRIANGADFTMVL